MIQDPLTSEERISIAKKHFEEKGYRVLSGLQFGCELVLYADDPNHVHSDFCVHVINQDSRLNWMTLQTMTRSMSDFKKTLIIVDVVPESDTLDTKYIVEELHITSGHSPFKRQAKADVGSQIKKKRI